MIKKSAIKKIILLAMLFVVVVFSGRAGGVVKKPPVSLLLISSFYGGPYQGLTGLDRYIFNYAQFLKNKGLPVVVVVADGAVIQQSFEQAGIPCSSWKFQTKKSAAKIQAFKQFIKNIVEQYSVTHVHCNMQQELHMVHAAIMQHKLPLFYTHHYQYSFPIDKHDYLSGVCVVDKLLVDKLAKKANVPVVFIPPFFDEVALREQSFADQSRYEVPVITMVGNMYHDLKSKNYPLLIDAVDKLVHIYKQPCQVLIVGDGPTRKHIESLVQQKNLAKQISFLGARRDVPAILAMSDIVVLTSKHEGFGMVLAEANILGKPVIGPSGTGVEGVIVDGLNGVLFANGSVDDFCKKCLMLLNNPIERLAMGLRAKAYADQYFSNEFVWGCMQQLYDTRRL